MLRRVLLIVTAWLFGARVFHVLQNSTWATNVAFQVSGWAVWEVGSTELHRWYNRSAVREGVTKGVSVLNSKHVRISPSFIRGCETQSNGRCVSPDETLCLKGDVPIC